MFATICRLLPGRSKPAPTDASDRSQEILRRLETLAAGHDELSRAVRELLDDQERTRPTRRTWMIATSIFAASLFIISVATSAVIHTSLINGQADTLHEEAQADRSQAIEDIVETLGPFEQEISIISTIRHDAGQLPIRADKALVTVIGSSEKLLTEADNLDSQADDIAGSTAPGLYIAEIALVFGSTVAGGIFGWAITQLLVTRRRKPTRA